MFKFKDVTTNSIYKGELLCIIRCRKDLTAIGHIVTGITVRREV